MQNYYAQAIYLTNQMAKKETDPVKRNRLYQIKEDGLRDLFEKGELSYTGSHYKIVPSKKSTRNLIRICHFYRCGEYSYHSKKLFPGLQFRFLGKFFTVC